MVCETWLAPLKLLLLKMVPCTFESNLYQGVVGVGCDACDAARVRAADGVSAVAPEQGTATSSRTRARIPI
jgi:DNA-binding helix-hairpin-helix protein with protein kinase domain